MRTSLDPPGLGAEPAGRTHPPQPPQLLVDSIPYLLAHGCPHSEKQRLTASRLLEEADRASADLRESGPGEDDPGFVRALRSATSVDRGRHANDGDERPSKRVREEISTNPVGRFPSTSSRQLDTGPAQERRRRPLPDSLSARVLRLQPRGRDSGRFAKAHPQHEPLGSHSTFIEVSQQSRSMEGSTTLD